MRATEIIPNLWLGDTEAAHDVTFLRDHHITCIMNCTDSLDFVKDHNCKRIRVPLKDNGKSTEIQWMYCLLDRGAEALYYLLQRYRVLVHCYAGRQRSVSIVLAFLMKYAELSLQEALDTVRSKHGQIGINFSQALSQYYLDLLASPRGRLHKETDGLST